MATPIQTSGERSSGLPVRLDGDSQPDPWVTPTVGNLLVLFAGGGSNGVITINHNFVQIVDEPWTGRGDGSMGLWTKISEGNETVIELQSTIAENHFLVGYEMSPEYVFDKYDVISGAGVTPPVSLGPLIPASNDAIGLVMSFHFSVGDTTFDSGYILDGNYAGGANSALFYQGWAHKEEFGGADLAVNPTWDGGPGDDISMLVSYIIVGGAAQTMSVYDGAQFVLGTPNVYDGAQWVPTVPRVFDGAAWIPT